MECPLNLVILRYFIEIDLNMDIFALLKSQSELADAPFSKYTSYFPVCVCRYARVQGPSIKLLK